MNIEELQEIEPNAVICKELQDGSTIAVWPFAFTWALVYDVDRFGYGGRFCFETLGDAIAAFYEYKGGVDEVPENTIKPKGRKKSPSTEFWEDNWGHNY